MWITFMWCTPCMPEILAVCCVFLQGEEVMNTYGQLGNTSLLHKYGFAELGNPHDKVRVA